MHSFLLSVRINRRQLSDSVLSPHRAKDRQPKHGRHCPEMPVFIIADNCGHAKVLSRILLRFYLFCKNSSGIFFVAQRKKL